MTTRIFVAGHLGMVGSAIVRQLSQDTNVELLLRSRSELDLKNFQSVKKFIQTYKPDQIYLAAAKVGGIHANNAYPATFIEDNIAIQSNVIRASHEGGIQKLLFLGSSCIYPQLATQPMKEEYLLTGKLEPTNEPYAIAKIAGIKMCESYNRQYGVDYRCLMPTNLYGHNDNFHLENSHVIPAMMRRFHEAKVNNDLSVNVWGTGKPMREFLYVDDMADASVHVMNLPNEKFVKAIPDPMCSHINVGTGKDITIKELADTMATVVNYSGDILFDSSRPDGTPRKLMDVSRLSALGWQYSTELKNGLEKTYKWFLNNLTTSRM
jgi:GDP-L-fucose synthase